MNSQNPGLVATLRWLWGPARPYSNWIYLTMVSSVVLVSFNIVRAFLVAELVESALGGDPGALTRVAVYLVPAAVLGVAATAGVSYGSRRAAVLTCRDLRTRVVDHVTRARMECIEKRQTGELITRLNADMNTVGSFLAHHLPNLGFQPLMFLCSSVYLVSINPKLYLACYALLPLLFYCANALNRRGAEYSRAYYDSLDEATSSVKQCLDGISTVKANNLGEMMVARSRSSFGRALGPLMRRELVDAISLPFFFLTRESPRIFCLLFGAYFTWRGEMSLGGLVAATQLVGYVSAPANALMGLLSSTRRTGVAVGRLAELLGTDTERPGGRPLFPVAEESCIEFRDVTYGYEPGETVLKGLSFSVPRRGVTAVVGGSGEGKSTVLNLLLGYHEPQAGQVLLFGQDICSCSLSSLRRQLAYVPQDSPLFPGTIADNIRLGSPGARPGEIRAAADACRVSEFALSFPRKLDTILAERGRGLSGGQRQRVALARAAVRRAPVILLDEPTSALDPKSEALINRALGDLARDAAVLVVSHRLRTVQSADHIVVLEEGRIVEQGTYDELLLGSGAFTRLFAPQLEAESAHTARREVAADAE